MEGGCFLYLGCFAWAASDIAFNERAVQDRMRLRRMLDGLGLPQGLILYPRAVPFAPSLSAAQKCLDLLEKCLADCKAAPWSPSSIVCLELWLKRSILRRYVDGLAALEELTEPGPVAHGILTFLRGGRYDEELRQLPTDRLQQLLKCVQELIRSSVGAEGDDTREHGLWRRVRHTTPELDYYFLQAQIELLLAKSALQHPSGAAVVRSTAIRALQDQDTQAVPDTWVRVDQVSNPTPSSTSLLSADTSTHRCFVLNYMFKTQDDRCINGRALRKGSRVLAADAGMPCRALIHSPRLVLGYLVRPH